MTTPSPSPRHRFFVDFDVQSAILIRAAIYTTAGTLYFAITLICTQWLHEPDRGLVDSLAKSFEDIAFWLPGFFLLLPIAAHDLIKMTNQFAGPIARLRREMVLLTQDKSDRPLSFREDDYWTDLIGSYNQIRGELLQLRRRLGEEEADLPPSLIDCESDEDEGTLPLPGSPMLTLPMAAADRPLAETAIV